MKTEQISRSFIDKTLDFDKEIILDNVLVGKWEADILVIDDLGFSHEYEVKTSRTSFFNGIKKDSPHLKHNLKDIFKNDKTSDDYTFNTYTVIMPEGSLKPFEVPEHIGIVYFSKVEGSKEPVFKTERLPKMIHHESFWRIFDQAAFMRTLCKRFFYKELA